MVTTFSDASDLHGDRQDRAAVAGFKKFVDDFKPNRRGFLGDLFNFDALRGGADEDEKRISMRHDFDAGIEFLEWYRPNYLTLGNHDQRLWDSVEKNGMTKTGPIADLASILIERFEKVTAKLGILVLPYDKRKGIYSEGGLKRAHGFDNNNAAKMAAAYGNIIFGHGHAIESATAPSDEHRVARMIGCLCQRNLTYNRAQINTLRQENGWAYGAYLGRRRHEVMQARINGDRVVYADHLKTIHV